MKNIILAGLTALSGISLSDGKKAHKKCGCSSCFIKLSPIKSDRKKEENEEKKYKIQLRRKFNEKIIFNRNVNPIIVR